MSKALFGTYVSAEHRALLEELWRLRQRVAELEAALAEAREDGSGDAPEPRSDGAAEAPHAG